MMKNLGGMMKKMQEVQARLEALNTEMESRIFSASVGGGAVTVNLTGKGRIDSIKIAPELCQEDEVETLEELVALAANTAKSEAEIAHKQALEEITGGMPLPPGLSLPF